MQIRRRALDAWLTDLRAGWGERAHGAALGVSPHLHECDSARLRAIGLHLADSGFTLEEVLLWFRLLARRSRALRRLLQSDGIANIAAGWADGVLSADFGAARVAPLEILRLRLHQQTALAASAGQPLGSQLALIVVEVIGPQLHADHVVQFARDEFRAGETVAVAPNGKVLILVQRHDDLTIRAHSLTNTLRADHSLRGSTVRVWIEPLGTLADHVDSHLLSLAS